LADWLLILAGRRNRVLGLATSGVVSAKSARRADVKIEALERRQLMSTVPNDPLYPVQYHLDNTGQLAEDLGLAYSAVGTPGADVSADLAWDLTTGSGDIVVAVLDSGLDFTHPDLIANVFTNPGEIPKNQIDDDANGYIDDVNGWDFADDDNDVTDIEGHGTHVSGIIGAVGNNGQGVSGVNWNVKILPIKVFRNTGQFNIDGYLAGVQYAIELKRQGVNVVAMNASLGGFSPIYPEVLAEATSRANDADILFVAAAGNDSSDVNVTPVYPARFALNLPNTITVASTTNLDELSDFSNYGLTTVQVAAPGTAVTSTWSRFSPEGFLYNSISGTSMAAPVVTGIAALAKAYVPAATPAQIKEAILAGVDVLPALDPLYSLPPFVSTTGRLNAYKVLRILANSVQGQLGTLGGNWIKAYGAQGHRVIGSTSSIPSYVSYTTDGATRIIDNSSKKAAALRTPDGQSRVLAYLNSDTSFAINLDFNDDQAHRVTLYAADTDKRGRAQTYSVVDASTGLVLRQINIKNFSKGKYVSFDLRGDVKLVVTRTGGGSAIVNGIFFDNVPNQREALVGTDTTTGGSWKGVYGTAGAFVVGDTKRFPNFVGVDVVGGKQSILESSTKDRQALQRNSSSSRTVGYLHNTRSFDIRVTFTDNQTRRVGIYMVDYDNKKRAQRLDLLDAAGNVLSNVIVSKFTKGAWAFFDLNTIGGAKTIRVTQIAGKDAVVSGIFFDASPQQNAFYQGIDSTTRGSWKGKFGFDGQFIPLDPDSAVPSFLTLTHDGLFTTVDISSNTLAAVQKIEHPTDRLKAYLEAPGRLTLDMNFTDSSSHRVSFYAADYRDDNRSQRLTLIDAETGIVLSNVDLNNFEKGKYVTYDLVGHVIVQITNLSGPSAVLSGIFFD